MTDNYFIGTTSRIHHANRFNNRHAIKSIISAVMGGASSARDLNELSSLTYEEAVENSESGAVSKEERGNIEMMVSLDHTIFFHNQATVRADVWMFSEMESPWTGDERSLVVQRVWSSQGTLLATCFQEGAIRLLQDTPQSKI
jgi:acyl-coenzyme A thioesterase 1/2/4